MGMLRAVAALGSGAGGSDCCRHRPVGHGEDAERPWGRGQVRAAGRCGGGHEGGGVGGRGRAGRAPQRASDAGTGPDRASGRPPPPGDELGCREQNKDRSTLSEKCTAENDHKILHFSARTGFFGTG